MSTTQQQKLIAFMDHVGGTTLATAIAGAVRMARENDQEPLMAGVYADTSILFEQYEQEDFYNVVAHCNVESVQRCFAKLATPEKLWTCWQDILERDAGLPLLVDCGDGAYGLAAFSATVDTKDVDEMIESGALRTY